MNLSPSAPGRHLSRPLKAVILSVAIVATAFSAFAITRAQGESDVVVCVAGNGAMRMVNTANDCRPNETAHTFSKQGTPGPAGATGEPGAPGSPGPAGPPGPAGVVTVNVNEGGESYSGPPHIFLEATGASGPAIVGESTVPGREGQIEVLDWQWGIKNNISLGSASGGAGAGKADFSSLLITRFVDSASPTLMNYAATARHIDELVLTGDLPNAAGVPQTRYVLTMTLALVASVDLAAAAGSAIPTEELVIEFGAVKVEYFALSPDGKPSPVPTSTFQWNRVTNTEN